MQEKRFVQRIILLILVTGCSAHTRPHQCRDAAKSLSGTWQGVLPEGPRLYRLEVMPNGTAGKLTMVEWGHPSAEDSTYDCNSILTKRRYIRAQCEGTIKGDRYHIVIEGETAWGPKSGILRTTLTFEYPWLFRGNVTIDQGSKPFKQEVYMHKSCRSRKSHP